MRRFKWWSYPESRIVETVYGRIQGRRLIDRGDKQVDAFQGIPFAKPPVGPLRFKKPQAPESWSGIKETKTWGDASMQIRIPYFMKGTASEDCLSLNVFTPSWSPPPGGFPVMVFVHGGGFAGGDAIAYGDKGICEHLVTCDVIVVTIQYRLGYLGFFSTGDAACPGNLGLWDQCEALKWIQLNIEAFGGNKDNVTVFGHSAGGASVDMLHCSPHSTGLFHKVIAMAGSADRAWSITPGMVNQSKKKADQLGISGYRTSEELLEMLRSVPANKFSTNMMNPDVDEGVFFETTPFIDGDFFPEPIDNLRKKAKPKPVMAGVTKEEGILFMLKNKPSLEALKRCLKNAAKTAGNDAVADDLVHLYCDSEAPLDTEQLKLLNIRALSDILMNTGTLNLCRKTAEAQNDPVYLYVFKHFNPKSLGIWRFFLPMTDSTHSTELPYLFRRSILSPSFKLRKQDDLEVADLFTTAVTNFAKHGNPNGPQSDQSHLPSRWDPVRAPGYCNNYVIDSTKAYMDDKFFEGRPAKYLKIIHGKNVKTTSATILDSASLSCFDLIRNTITL